MSTNFAKTLVCKHENDVKLWRQKQRTPNGHHMTLNQTPPWKFSAYATGYTNAMLFGSTLTLPIFVLFFFFAFFQGSSVEFAFHPQHETSWYSEIQMKDDFNYFKNKSRKRTRSWSMFSVNSNDWEEHWNTKSHQKMDWIQKNEAGTKRRLKTFRLQGHLNVYLFKPLCIYTPHVIASHN